LCPGPFRFQFTPGRPSLTRDMGLLASQSKSHSTIKHSLLSILHFATLGRDHGRRGPFSEPLSCFQGLRDPSGTVLGADVKRIRLSKMPPGIRINPFPGFRCRFGALERLKTVLSRGETLAPHH